MKTSSPTPLRHVLIAIRGDARHCARDCRHLRVFLNDSYTCNLFSCDLEKSKLMDPRGLVRILRAKACRDSEHKDEIVPLQTTRFVKCAGVLGWMQIQGVLIKRGSFYHAKCQSCGWTSEHKVAKMGQTCGRPISGIVKDPVRGRRTPGKARAARPPSRS